MMRMAASSVLGFVLVVIETFIVMKIKGYTAIYFDDMSQFVNVWAMNFFLVFTMLTQFKMWLDNRSGGETSDANY